MSLDLRRPIGWSTILKMEALLELYQWRKMNLTLKHFAASTEELRRSAPSFHCLVISSNEQSLFRLSMQHKYSFKVLHCNWPGYTFNYS